MGALNLRRYTLTASNTEAEWLTLEKRPWAVSDGLAWAHYDLHLEI